MDDVVTTVTVTVLVEIEELELLELEAGQAHVKSTAYTF
jgi:hypothetical protein